MGAIDLSGEQNERQESDGDPTGGASDAPVSNRSASEFLQASSAREGLWIMENRWSRANEEGTGYDQRLSSMFELTMELVLKVQSTSEMRSIIIIKLLRVRV